MRIEDDFLSQEDLDKLDSIISSYHFPWFFQKNQTWDDDPFFCHVMYCLDMPESQFYPQVSEIFKKHLNWTSMYRLNVNLVPKIGSTSNFHTDVNEEHNEEEFIKILSKKDYKKIKKRIANIILNPDGDASVFTNIPQQFARLDTLKVQAENEEDNEKMKQLEKLDKYLINMQSDYERYV